MRWVLDILVAVMLVGILAGVMHYNRSGAMQTENRKATQAALSRIKQEVALRSALETGDLTDRGYPISIDPDWFTETGLPRNLLVGPDHAWLEIAGTSQRRLSNPPSVIAADVDDAQFWYNPFLGIVRARVPLGNSDAEALAVYNELNGTRLKSLYSGG